MAPHRGSYEQRRLLEATSAASSSLVDCSSSAAACGSLLWPLPASYAAGSTDLCVPTSLAFELDGEARTPAAVRGAVELRAYIFAHGDLDATCEGATLRGVRVVVSDGADGYPALDDDVSYSLTVDVSGGATLTAATVWGALHGLETFSQLISFRRSDKSYVLENAPVQIEGAARQRRVVPDGVAPLPELWASAFSDYEVYTARELRRFVEYARVRGVAVLPEFDTPGHSKSMCRGAPDDVCMETCSTDNWPLRPLNRTLEYLGDLYEELYGGDDALFPFALAHTGGDEVKYDCWDEDNASSTFLADRNLTSKQAYLLMLNTNARIMRERGGRRPVAWDDAYYYYRDDVGASITLMFWSNVADLMQEAADAGHELVAAPSTPLYLSADDDWGCGDVYNYDPCDPSNPVDSDNTVNTTASCARVLGIEAAAWGEVMDASTLLATLFPRDARSAWSSRTSFRTRTSPTAPTCPRPRASATSAAASSRAACRRGP
ncbi:N-acetyl-beta-D-galactosaminidase [Aureococcus anophagefferens]|nr:N-acetyl-beta-D-galactosaminidase [Aureococcus anophagefferens]